MRYAARSLFTLKYAGCYYLFLLFAEEPTTFFSDHYCMIISSRLVMIGDVDVLTAFSLRQTMSEF